MTVTKWESGRHEPTEGNLQDVAHALSMTVASLRAFGAELTSGGAMRVREEAARYQATATRTTPRIPPRAYQLIYERVQLMEKAHVPEPLVDELRRLMADDSFNTLNMRTATPRTEQGWIDDIDAAWAFIQDLLHRRGYKL